MIDAPEFSASLRVRFTEHLSDEAIIAQLSNQTAQRILSSVLDTGADQKGFWADVVMVGTYQDVMAALMMIANSPEAFSTWRYRLGRFLMHLGLRVLPHGRCRSELSAMMWTWGMKVQATAAANV